MRHRGCRRVGGGRDFFAATSQKMEATTWWLAG
jgi:hypothetical protein